MALAALFSAAAQAAGSSSGVAPAAPISHSGDINVNPVGINFGEILKPYTDSAHNGGFGLTMDGPEIGPAPFWRPRTSTPATGSQSFDPSWLIVAAVGVVGVLFLLRRRWGG